MHFLAKFVLLFAMLYVQHSAAVHAVEHVAHHHDEQELSCEVFFAAERLADTTLQNLLPSAVCMTTAIFYVEKKPVAIELQALRPRSRSPPFFLS